VQLNWKVYIGTKNVYRKIQVYITQFHYSRYSCAWRANFWLGLPTWEKCHTNSIGRRLHYACYSDNICLWLVSIQTMGGCEHGSSTSMSKKPLTEKCCKHDCKKSRFWKSWDEFGSYGRFNHGTKVIRRANNILTLQVGFLKTYTWNKLTGLQMRYLGKASSDAKLFMQSYGETTRSSNECRLRTQHRGGSWILKKGWDTFVESILSTSPYNRLKTWKRG